MWSNVLTNKQQLFHFHIELTSKCNAACPHCPRYLRGLPIRQPSVNLWEMKFSDVKKWYSPSIIKKIGSINFCGNFGDPCVCNDMYEIVEYFHLNNPETEIEIRTNGGARDTTFWKKVGTLSYKSNRKIRVMFGIDGLEDTNHLYRRNINWKTLEKNVRAYNNAGGYSGQEFLIFEHNEHQIDAAKENASDWGIEFVTYKQAIGFEDWFAKKSIPLPVYDKKGKLDYLIKPAKQFKNSEFPYHDNKENILDEIPTFNDTCYVEPTPIDYEIYSESETSDIKCKSVHDNGHIEVYFNSNGDVRPCCHIGVEIDRNLQDGQGKQLKEILGPPHLYNLRTNSLENILDLFDIRIEGTWDKTHEQGRCLKCSMQCGVSSQTDESRLFGANDKIYKTQAESDSAAELEEIQQIIDEMFNK